MGSWWKRAWKQPPIDHSQPQPIPNIGGEIPKETAAELRGYRYWRVVSDGTHLALKSLHAEYVWERWNTATCMSFMANSRNHDTSSPDIACACGIYAENPDHPLAEWQTFSRGVVSASGSILMYGRILVCEMGYKAQYAEVETPVVLRAQCQMTEDGPCDQPAKSVSIPAGRGSSYHVACKQHSEGTAWDSIGVGEWMRHAAEDLSRRYEVDFISEYQLGGR